MKQEFMHCSLIWAKLVIILLIAGYSNLPICIVLHCHTGVCLPANNYLTSRNPKRCLQPFCRCLPGWWTIHIKPLDFAMHVFNEKYICINIEFLKIIYRTASTTTRPKQQQPYRDSHFAEWVGYAEWYWNNLWNQRKFSKNHHLNWADI